MIAFDVKVNGKRACLAGIPGYAVLTAILTWVRRHPRPPHLPRETSELTLDVSGLESNFSPRDEGKHLRWLTKKVGVGDTITIQVLEREKVDAPRRRYPKASPEQMEKARKRSARHYLREYKLRRRELDKRIARLEAGGKQLKTVPSRRRGEPQRARRVRKRAPR
jgi:hypothetical protein